MTNQKVLVRMKVGVKKNPPECEYHALTKDVNITNYPPQKYAGDGKLPNLYWVYGDDGYFIFDGDEEVWVGDAPESLKKMLGVDYNPEYEEEPKVYKTYRAALKRAGDLAGRYGLRNVVIEDRLTGVVNEFRTTYYFHEETVIVKENGKTVEKTALVAPKEPEYEWLENVGFSREQIEKCGYDFE